MQKRKVEATAIPPIKTNTFSMGRKDTRGENVERRGREEGEKNERKRGKVEYLQRKKRAKEGNKRMQKVRPTPEPPGEL